jgi:hypothetical protein
MISNSLNFTGERPAGTGNPVVPSMGCDRKPRNAAKFLN